jgi:hypothetical protein
MKGIVISHDWQPGTVVRLTQPVVRRELDSRQRLVLEAGGELEVIGPDGEFAGVPAYRVRDTQGRVWRGILAAWCEPVGGPAGAADSLFE